MNILAMNYQNGRKSVKILAIDTSTEVSTVALIDESHLLSEIVINSNRNHSEKLMLLVDDVIKSTGYSIKDIDLFSCSVGPGSFTGLRISIATVKGLAQSLGKHVLGISTLEAIAFNIMDYNNIICPVIDAQRDQVYTSMYKWENNKLNNLTGEMVLSIESLLNEIKQKGKKVILVGNAIHKFSTQQLKDIQGLIEVAPVSHRMPRASSVGNLAMIKYQMGLRQSNYDLVPNYIRKSQAEIQLEMKKRVGNNEN